MFLVATAPPLGGRAAVGGVAATSPAGERFVAMQAALSLRSISLFGLESGKVSASPVVNNQLGAVTIRKTNKGWRWLSLPALPADQGKTFRTAPEAFAASSASTTCGS